MCMLSNLPRSLSIQALGFMPFNRHIAVIARQDAAGDAGKWLNKLANCGATLWTAELLLVYWRLTHLQESASFHHAQ